MIDTNSLQSPFLDKRKGVGHLAQIFCWHPLKHSGSPEFSALLQTNACSGACFTFRNLTPDEAHRWLFHRRATLARTHFVGVDLQGHGVHVHLLENDEVRVTDKKVRKPSHLRVMKSCDIQNGKMRSRASRSNAKEKRIWCSLVGRRRTGTCVPHKYASRWMRTRRTYVRGFQICHDRRQSFWKVWHRLTMPGSATYPRVVTLHCPLAPLYADLDAVLSPSSVMHFGSPLNTGVTSALLALRKTAMTQDWDGGNGNLPVYPRSFDLAVVGCIDATGYVVGRREFWMETHRVVRPDGVTIVTRAM